jgi:hypothetical protein
LEQTRGIEIGNVLVNDDAGEINNMLRLYRQRTLSSVYLTKGDPEGWLFLLFQLLAVITLI